MIALAILNMNYMYHKLTMSEKIMQEKMGKNLWIVIPTGLKSKHQSDMYRKWIRLFWKNYFEQKCVLIRVFLNQGEISSQC